MIPNHMVNSERQKKTEITQTKSTECVHKLRSPCERLSEETSTSTESPNADLGCLQLIRGASGLRSKLCFSVDSSLIL